MKIYTKNGDKGETGYIGGRTSKASGMMEVLGELDELNALLGLVLASGINQSKDIEKQQSLLLSIGSIVANPNATEVDATKISREIKSLERKIDNFASLLPELKSFILPGGSESGSRIHVARSVSRRAERVLVKYLDGSSAASDIYKKGLLISEKYLNRLSDYLFQLARFVNVEGGSPETIWMK